MQNHIGTVHVIAICNGLEAAMGSLAEASVPAHKRWIPKGMDVRYTAKATTDITCIAETDPDAWTGDDPDLPVRVRGVREDGVVVVEGVIRLWVTEKPRADPGVRSPGRCLADQSVGHLERLLLPTSRLWTQVAMQAEHQVEPRCTAT